MSIDLGELATAIGQIILRFRLRRRTAGEWSSINEVLLLAEIGYETDTTKIKIGDGVSVWNDLEYWGGTAGFELDSDNAGAGISIDQVLPGGDDPLFAGVALLMHFDGTTKDSSSNDLSVVAHSGATTTTADALFGSSGLIPPNTGGYWELADNDLFDFGADDWTIEGWFFPVPYTVGSTTYVSIPAFGKWGSVGGATALLGIAGTDVYLTDSTGASMHLTFFNNQYTDATTGGTIISTNPNPMTNNQWNHLAVERDGTKIRMFVNGFELFNNSTGAFPVVAGGWDIGSVSLNSLSSPFLIGKSGSSGVTGFQSAGLIDEFRVTGANARYAAGFAVPTDPFFSTDTPLLTVITNIGIRGLEAGTGISIDNTDPFVPKIINTSGGGTGASSVELLLHFEGGPGIDDDGDSPKTVTAVGDAQISTADFKFGSSSLLLDGSGDYLTVQSNRLIVGNSDFQFDCWVNFTSVGSQQFVMDSRESTAVGTGFAIYVQSGELAYYDTSAGAIISTGAPVTATTWHHIECDRKNGVVYVFVDGVLKAVGSTGAAQLSRSWCIGAGQYTPPGAAPMAGYIDEVHFVVGAAAHTVDFTPPTGAY